MSVDWGAIEQAVRGWIKTATSLNDANVIRADQDGPKPSVPFVDIALGDLIALGACDPIETEYDEGADPGEEIIESVRGQREFVVVIRAFSAAAVGTSSAYALLSKAQTALGLSTVRDALHAAGITVFNAGRVASVPRVVATAWQGIAELRVGFYTCEDVSLATGYINKVELIDEMPDPDRIIPLALEGELSIPDGAPAVAGTGDPTVT